MGSEDLFGQPSIQKSRTYGDCTTSEVHINADYMGKYIFDTQCHSLCDVVRHSCEMTPLRKEQCCLELKQKSHTLTHSVTS